jgi:hypothetical protein
MANRFISAQTEVLKLHQQVMAKLLPSPAFPKTPAAFYLNSRLLLKIAGGLLKFALNAFGGKPACFWVSPLCI